MFRKNVFRFLRRFLVVNKTSHICLELKLSGYILYQYKQVIINLDIVKIISITF